MARTTRVVLTCDLHGDETEAATTVLVTNGKKRVELDLCQDHIDELVGAGRKAAGSKARASTNGRKNGKKAKVAGGRTEARQNAPSTAAVREWATTQGYSVSSRGRVPADVRAAYLEAHEEETAGSS